MWHESGAADSNTRGQWATELLIVSAPTRDALIDRVQELHQTLSPPADAPLSPLAQHLAGQPSEAFRLAVVAGDRPALQAKLALALERLTNPARQQFEIQAGVYYAAPGALPETGRTAFLFPGLGSEYPEMFTDLRHCFPSIQAWFESLREVAHRATNGRRATSGAGRDQGATYNFGEGALGTFVMSLALHELLEALAVPCDVMAGYSNGENAALIASRTIRFGSQAALLDVLITIAASDEQLDSTEVNGGFFAVSGLTPAQLQQMSEVSGGQLYVTMVNCPSQVVIYVVAPYMETVVAQITAAGGVTLRLPFQRPIHTPLYQHQQQVLRPIYAEFDIRQGTHPVYSCATGRPFPDDPQALRELASQQWTSQVRFQQTIEQLYANGVRTFIEVGPDSTLTGFVRDILRGQKYFAAASNSRHRPGLEQVQRLVAQLYVRGVPVDIPYFFAGRAPAAAAPPPVAKRPAAPPAAPAAGRQAQAVTAAGPALLTAHFELMRQFLESQARVVGLIAGALQESNAPAPILVGTGGGDSYPLLGHIIERDADHLYSERTFSIAQDRFLEDHTLGHKTAAEHPDLLPLPVLPLTFSAEILAEAAACLLDGKVVVGIEKVRSYRWLGLDQGRLTVGVRAQLQPHAAPEWSVQVQLFELGTAGGRQLAVEGTIRLAEQFPAAPAPTIAPPERSMPPRLPLETFYGVYTFHGPRFQGIRRIRHVGDEGIEGEIVLPATGDFVQGVARLAFQVPATVLDCFGQLTFVWLLEHGRRDFVIFPFQMVSYRQYAPCPAPGTTLLCRGRIALGDTIITGSFELLDPAGRLFGRAEQFQLRYFNIPEVSHFFEPPGPERYFSVAWPAEDGAPVRRAMAGFTPALLEQSGSIWARVLAHLVLNQAERAFWYTLPEDSPRRLRWLLERTAIKDALRQWSRERHALILAPYDIEVPPVQNGRLSVRCPPLERQGIHPEVSTGQSGEVIFAAVAGPALA